MSLFDDDFYSTKVSSWNRRTTGRRRVRFSNNRSLGITAGLLIVFFIISFITLPWMSGRTSSGPIAQDSVAAKEPADRNDISNLFVEAGEKVRPAVVSVISKLGDSEQGVPESMGIGSGVIFHKKGNTALIVTNNHVVDGASAYEVVLSNGDKKNAKLVGKDLMTDLAVLEVDGKGIEDVAKFGDSSKLKAGEMVIAIGNPLGLGFSQTITFGIISWPERKIPVSLGMDGTYDWETDVIQTDAAINQGNSGGALVNHQGEVIGINSLKVADMGVEGLGFAIPINDAIPVIESLIEHGKVKRPFVGIVGQDLQLFTGTEVLKLPEQVKTGIIVMEAVGPAKEAGLATNDVIVQLDGTATNSMLEFRKYLYSQKAIGDEIEVTYYRDGKKRTASFTLGEMNNEQ